LRLANNTIASRANNGNIKNYSQVPLGSDSIINHYYENTMRLYKKLEGNKSTSQLHADQRSDAVSVSAASDVGYQQMRFQNKTQPVSPRMVVEDDAVSNNSRSFHQT
jgi:hypothetical protein